MSPTPNESENDPDSSIMIRRILMLSSMVCVLGAITVLIFINISGTSNNSFVQRFYFSELDGDYRWTMYGLCQRDPHHPNQGFKCTKPRPAYPYSPAQNFNFVNVPREFIVNGSTYYYLSRIAYAFFLLAWLFTVLTFLSMLVTGCSRGSRGSTPATTVSFMAFIFYLTASTLNTAAHVKGVQVFQDAFFSASIGRDMFVCMWVGVGLMLISVVCLGWLSRLDRQRLTHPKMLHP